jgi:hypothetical protein
LAGAIRQLLTKGRKHISGFNPQAGRLKACMDLDLRFSWPLTSLAAADVIT